MIYTILVQNILDWQYLKAHRENNRYHLIIDRILFILDFVVKEIAIKDLKAVCWLGNIHQTLISYYFSVLHQRVYHIHFF